MSTETFFESLRALCADEARLRELGLLNSVDELVPAMLAVLDDLEFGRLAVRVGSAQS